MKYMSCDYRKSCNEFLLLRSASLWLAPIEYLSIALSKHFFSNKDDMRHLLAVRMCS
jgi:hypothetical protein